MSQYTRDFQVNLLVHLARDAAFFQDTLGQLRLSDFEMPGCQLIYESLYGYFKRYRQLPDFPVLRLEVQRLAANLDGKTQTTVTPEQHADVAYTMGCIVSLAQLNTAYYRDQLHDYLQAIRLNQTLAEFQGSSGNMDPSKLIQQVAQLKQDVAGHNDISLDNMIGNPTGPLCTNTAPKVPTCLTNLNLLLSGGLAIQEIGMIIAATGVGKTTGLINFAWQAVCSGKRILFISLELPKSMIINRFISIAAHIPIGTFDLPIETWPVADVRKYRIIHEPQYNRYLGYDTVVESSRKLSVSDIENTIIRWREKTAREGHDPAECQLVCVDWLDWISPEGVGIHDKNANKTTELTAIAEALALMGKRQKVALWTATQATREAVGKEVLRLDMTAQAYHKNDPLDVSMSIAPQNVTAAIGGRIAEGVQVSATECDRTMVAAILKNRRGKPGVTFNFYQGPTLKFWNSRTEANLLGGNFKTGKEEDFVSAIYGDKSIDRQAVR